MKNPFVQLILLVQKLRFWFRLHSVWLRFETKRRWAEARRNRPARTSYAQMVTL